jgi:hypothetical protein
MQRLVWQNSNGDEINLTSGNYGITNWEGFANTSLNIQSQQVPFRDGGVFLDALMEQRELSVTLAMYDGGNLETRYRLRRELVHALNPKLGEGYLIYTNDFISKRIKCVAQIPLFETHNSNNSGTPKASLAWTACDPYWEDLEETEISLWDLDNNSITIENNGEVDVGVQIQMMKKSNQNSLKPYIQNVTQAKIIQFTKPLQDNSYNEPIKLNIDTREGQKKVYYKNCVEIANMKLMNNNIREISYSDLYQCFYGIETVGNDYILKKSIDGENWENVLTTTYEHFYMNEDIILLYNYANESYMSIKIGINFSEWKEVTTDFYVQYASEISEVLVIEPSNYIQITFKYGMASIYNSIFFRDDLESYQGNFTAINSSASSLSLIYHEGLKKLFGIYGTEVYYIYPTSRQQVTIEGYIYNVHNKGTYIRELNTMFVYGDSMYGNVDYSEDGIHWNRFQVGGTIFKIIYMINKLIIVGNYDSNLLYPLFYWLNGLESGAGGGQLDLIGQQSGETITDVFYNPNKNNLLLIANFGTYNKAIMNSDFETENVISDLSASSDLNFKLLVGSNKIICSNSMNVVIKYRQKYIGV